MYTIVTIIKLKRAADRKKCFNCSFKLTVRKVMLFCVKLNQLKERCQCKDNCKLR